LKILSPLLLFIFLKIVTIILHIKKPATNPKKQETKRPFTVFIHSAEFIASKPPFIATALPVSPAIKAWLSLVGMPKYQAKTAHKTIENNAAARAMAAFFVSPPKSTMLLIVTVTESFILLIRATPKKLKTADITRADRSFIHLVTTTVEMAFGASVKPFTKTTAKVRSTVVTESGDKDNTE
jgi:hypothetical protein